MKQIRSCLKRYSNEVVVVKDELDSFNDFDLFLKKWKFLRQKSHFRIHTGYDKEFISKHVTKWINNLIIKFFYIDNVLVGYGVIEKIKKGQYNYLFGKALTSYPGLCLYIDVKMFEFIFSIENDTFIINMGSNSGKRGNLRYKTKSFPVEQIVFENYDCKIISEMLK